MRTKLHTVIFYLFLLFTAQVFAVEALPVNLVDFSSKEGERYFAQNVNPNLIKLLTHFTTQETTTYCGPASIVMVLNSSSLAKPPDSLHAPFHYFNQQDFFTDQVNRIVTREKILQEGMTLSQLGQAVQSFGLPTTIYYADQLSSSDFRKTLRWAIAHQQFVIINFLRSALQQVGGGHHSPVAAYDQKSDRFLILDVARYKYSAYWVATEELWNAANTRDGDKSRGFIVIEDVGSSR